MKLIDDYQDYKISENGDVFRVKNNKRVKATINKQGYYRLKLYKNGICKTFQIHRLVALTYLEILEGKNQVNHIDGNKLNNHISNLEWCNNSQNQLHAYKLGLNYISDNGKRNISNKNSKLVLDTKTGIFYSSAKEASYYNQVNYYTLNDYLNNKCPNKTSLIYA